MAINPGENEDETILHRYEKGPYVVRITENRQSGERFYKIYNNPAIQPAYAQIIHDYKLNLKIDLSFEQNKKFRWLYKKFEFFVSNLINRNIEYLSEGEILELVNRIVFEILVLEPVYVFMVDDNIKSIFLSVADSKLHPVYPIFTRWSLRLNHTLAGECRASFSLTDKQLENIIKSVKIEANIHKYNTRQEEITAEFNIDSLPPANVTVSNNSPVDANFIFIIWSDTFRR